MKKLLFIPILAFGIFLVGCNQQQGLSESELFEMGVKCIDLKEKIKEEKEVIIDGMPILIIDDVFFSKKRNSCLYIIKYNRAIDFKKDPLISTSYELVDYFKNSLVDYCMYGINQKDDYRTKEFRDFVKELKWE